MGHRKPEVEGSRATLTFDQMHLTAALRTLVQCGIFDKIPKDGGSIGSKELAEAAGIDESVVRKVPYAVPS